MTETSNEVALWAVLTDIASERRRQDARWGEQDHPDTHPRLSAVDFQRLYKRKADEWKATNDARVQRGSVAWDGILLEEVYEALAEGDDDRLYEELIQTAAVAACWAQAIKRRRERQT